jgi:2-polyprenyl-6-methoxyphenol hydroxylase-like FAD-dependent oxidoreductase
MSAAAYDVIVVVARCLGSPTAMLLARKDYRVLLVDRVTFPRDTMRNHFIHGPGIASLKRWGLLDRIVDSGCPAVRHMTFDLGDFPLTFPVEPIDGVDANYAPRRFVLDALLAHAAAEAGAELREGFSVQELVFADGQVVGIRGRSRGGGVAAERAAIVVGADGLHSLVARIVQAPVYNTRPTLTCGYYTYFAGIPLDRMAMAIIDKRFMIAFPTHGDLTCVAVQAPVAEFPSFRLDVEAAFSASIARVWWFAELVAPGRRAERWLGTADLPNQFRKPYGPGWALVGDAGYHKDPLTAQGITDAFRDAELLTAAIDAGFTGRLSLASALADYERRRNEATRSSYAEAVAMASFLPFPPEIYAQRAALRPAA